MIKPILDLQIRELSVNVESTARTLCFLITELKNLVQEQEVSLITRDIQKFAFQRSSITLGRIKVAEIYITKIRDIIEKEL